jgi:hypothetical protein
MGNVGDETPGVITPLDNVAASNDTSDALPDEPSKPMSISEAAKLATFQHHTKTKVAQAPAPGNDTDIFGDVPAPGPSLEWDFAAPLFGTPFHTGASGMTPDVLCVHFFTLSVVHCQNVGLSVLLGVDGTSMICLHKPASELVRSHTSG